MNAPHQVFALRGFGVAFGDRVVLNEINLEMDSPGMLTVMGPVGTGKSTLLRTLAGINQAVPSFRSWGEAVYAGAPLGSDPAAALVAQNARLLMSSVLENVIGDLPDRSQLTPLGKRETALRLLAEAGIEGLGDNLEQPVVELPLAAQRHLAMVRTVASNPLLLCVDEPTAGLERKESLPLLHFLRQQGEQRAVLVVSHNRHDALELGGHTALLAGGTIQARAPAQLFFEAPDSQVATDFVRTGSCSLPSPGARPEDIDESMLPLLPALPEEAIQFVPERLGPRGFMWLKKGRLAGTPLPGVVQDAEYDLEALRRVGVTTLVSLTMRPVDPALLKRYDIEGVWMPIRDMHAPGIDEAEQMCRQMADRMVRGHIVAYHCRAGLGRTGTMLVSHLIMDGQSAVQALDSVRQVERRWVQSDEQISFLERFAESLSSLQSRGGQAAAVRNEA